MIKNKPIYYIFCLLLFGGILLRFYNLQFNTIFDWDQENSIAYPAKDILVNHHLTLIGPRTGVGDLHLAPLYTYLSAVFFSILHLDPISGAVMAGFISSVTILISFLLIRNLFDKTTAFYFILIWAISPFIISLDRIPWNVNLFSLASLFVMSGLIKLLKGKQSSGYLLTGLGLLIGFSSHYTVFFLLAVILFFALKNKKITKDIGFTVVLGFIGILPILLFNLRHSQLFSQNLYRFGLSFITSQALIFERVKIVTEAILNVSGKIFLGEEASWIVQILAMVLFISVYLLRDDSKIKTLIRIFIFYIAVYLLGFSFYSGEIPSYYFTGLFPPIILAGSLLTEKIIDKAPRSIPVFFLIISILFLKSFLLVNQVNTQSLGMKEEVIKKIKEKTGSSPVKIIFDTELGWSYGYNYLLDYYGIRQVNGERNNIFWISYPKSRFPLIPDNVFGDIALGYPETVTKIFDTKQVEFYDNQFKIRIPKSFAVLRCQGIDFDQYFISSDNTVSCKSIAVANKGILIENLPGCNIWEMEDTKPLKSNTGLPVYILNNTTQNPVMSFERNRCIKFTDKENMGVTPLLSEIFQTLKK